METHGDMLRLDPYWPKRLGTLQLGINYRGHAVTVTIADHTVGVGSSPGRLPPVQVSCHGQVRELSNGQTVEFRR